MNTRYSVSFYVQYVAYRDERLLESFITLVFLPHDHMIRSCPSTSKADGHPTPKDLHNFPIRPSVGDKSSNPVSVSKPLKQLPHSQASTTIPSNIEATLQNPIKSRYPFCHTSSSIPSSLHQAQSQSKQRANRPVPQTPTTRKSKTPSIRIRGKQNQRWQRPASQQSAPQLLSTS